MKRNLAMTKMEADIFRLLFLGHGATISRYPLLNILVWMVFCASRGGGERVQERGAATMNATDGGAVGWKR